MNQTTHPASRRRFLGAAGALACLTAAAQAGALDWSWGWGRDKTVEGNGKVQRQAREVGHFSGVALSLAGKVEVRRGEREGVTIEADDNLLPLIETVVEDGMLKIRNRRGTNIRTRNLKVFVQARELSQLSLGGSGSIDADRVDGAHVEFDIGGSGTITVGKVEGGRVGINLGGKGTLKANEGSARSVSISIGGMGDVDLAHVRSDSADVTVAGSGNATLWVRDKLDLTVAGSGDVGYYGDPRVSKTVLGSGTLRRLGAAPR